MNDETHSKDRKFANTLARGMAVLWAFRASGNGLNHAQIAQRTGLPKPMISRLTYMLCEPGYLSHGARNERFRLGLTAVALGSVASLSISFVDLAPDAMHRLADKTGTLTLIAERDGDRMPLAKTWRARDLVTIRLAHSHRIPMPGSSLGQAVVSSMGEDRFAMLSPDVIRYASTIKAVWAPYFATELGEPVAFTRGAMPRDLPHSRLHSHVGPALRDIVRALETTQTGHAPALARRG